MQCVCLFQTVLFFHSFFSFLFVFQSSIRTDRRTEGGAWKLARMRGHLLWMTRIQKLLSVTLLMLLKVISFFCKFSSSHASSGSGLEKPSWFKPNKREGLQWECYGTHFRKHISWGERSNAGWRVSGLFSPSSLPFSINLETLNLENTGK